MSKEEKTGRKSFRERLADKRKDLARRGGGKSNVIFLKDGDTIRFRILNPGKEKDFILDVESFYLGGDVKNVYSPHTFGGECAFHQKYEELKNSKNKGDKNLGKKLVPRKKPMTAVLVYEDLKGQTVDEEQTGKLLQLTSSIAAEIIDYFLDETDWGDFTDPENGYDFKMKRTGAGQFDTEYTVTPCKPTPLPKKYRDMVIDLEETVKAILPTYEETEEMLADWLKTSSEDDDDEEDKPRRKKDREEKRKHNSDLDD